MRLGFRPSILEGLDGTSSANIFLERGPENSKRIVRAPGAGRVVELGFSNFTQYLAEAKEARAVLLVSFYSRAEGCTKVRAARSDRGSVEVPHLAVIR